MTAPVCLLQGTIIDVNGQPLAGTGVRAHLAPDDNQAVFVASGELVGREPVNVITDVNGFFEMNLVRGLQCVVTVDVLGFAKKITVPDAPTAQLKDL